MKAVQAGFAPPAQVVVGAIAALPVLPSAFSSATAEPRRSGETAQADQGQGDGLGAAVAERDPLVVALGGPVRVLGADGQAVVPVRVSDLAPAREQDQEAPACRPGENAALGSGPESVGQPDPLAREGLPGGADQPPPLPHCRIEIDPDGDDGDVIARAQGQPPGEGASQPASAKAPPAAQAQEGDKQAPEGTAKAPQASAASAAADAAASQPAAAAPAASAAPAHDTPLVITDAAKGVGVSVIDPLLPVETVTFGGDFAIVFPPASPAALPVVDLVPEVLAAPAAPVPAELPAIVVSPVEPAAASAIASSTELPAIVVSPVEPIPDWQLIG